MGRKARGSGPQYVGEQWRPILFIKTSVSGGKVTGVPEIVMVWEDEAVVFGMVMIGP